MTTFAPYSSYLHVSSSVSLSLTSVILWIGDLNYRISELDVSNVKELISNKDFETLHSYDQVISITFISSFAYLNRLFSSFLFVSGDTNQLHMVHSSRGRSMRRPCLLASQREGLISSPPTNMTPALTSGIQGNLIPRPDCK